MADFTTLTEATARDLIDLLRRDRASQRGGPAMVGNFVPQGPLVTRWAKTSTTPDYGTYPSSGNVVGVIFGEYEPSPIYPGATATKTFTAYDPAWYEFATLENGSMPSVGTIVRCTWRDGRWWILQDSTGGVARCVLIGQLSSGAALNSSNSDDFGMRYMVSTAGSPSSTTGMWVFPDWDGEFSNSAGTVFREDGYSVYTDEALNLLEDVKYRLTVHTVWRLLPLSQANAETYIGRDIGGGVYCRDLDSLTFTVQTAVSINGGTETIVGQSSIENFYETGAGTYHRYACHSGVVLYDLTSSGSPATLRIRAYRSDYHSIFNSQASLYDMQLTIEQITDN
jgi:hypothetical protein